MNIFNNAFAKVLLVAAALLLFVLLINSVIRVRLERATFERCRDHHEEILEKLKSFERLKQSETAANDDVAWHNACETIQLKFGMSWGHFPSRVTEDTYHRLSDDLDAILQADLARSVILENVWIRIGSSSPHLRRQFEVKDSLFESYISQLRETEHESHIPQCKRPRKPFVPGSVVWRPVNSSFRSFTDEGHKKVSGMNGTVVTISYIM